MTNQIPQESAPTISSPTMPTAGQGVVGGQPTSPAQVTFTPEQIEYLKPFIETQAQSLKDRRFSELEKAVNELRSGFQQPVQPQTQGVSPANGTPQVAQPAPELPDYLSPIRAVGLDANDPDVLRLMMQHGGNVDIFKSKLIDLKSTRLNQPPPSPAAVMPSYNAVPPSDKPDISGITDPGTLLKMASGPDGSLILPKRRGQ